MNCPLEALSKMDRINVNKTDPSHLCVAHCKVP
jgi:hypothetical protein